MITSQQIRAARALLGFSEEQVAAMTGVDPLALAKAENDAEERNFAVAEAIEKAFRKNGVAFIEDGENGFGPGVRLLRSSEQRRSIRPEDLNSANDG